MSSLHRYNPLRLIKFVKFFNFFDVWRPVLITGIMLSLFSASVVLSCSDSNTGSDPDTNTPTTTTVTSITVTSPDFNDGAAIPKNQYGDHTSSNANFVLPLDTDFLNVSPKILLTDNNANVQSHILLMLNRTARNSATTGPSATVNWFHVNIMTNDLTHTVGNTNNPNYQANNHGYTFHNFYDTTTTRSYYGPQPQSGTNTYDVLLFGIDQPSVDISTYANFNAMTTLYNDLIVAYDNTIAAVQTVTINGVSVQLLSKGKFSGTATNVGGGGNPSGGFTVTSTSYVDGGTIPEAHVSDFNARGAMNLNPQLSWANAPAGTSSYIVHMYDQQAPNFPHWLLTTNTTTSSIVAGSDSSYFGPSPPTGSTHTYHILIFALQQGNAVITNDWGSSVGILRGYHNTTSGALTQTGKLTNQQNSNIIVDVLGVDRISGSYTGQ